MLDIIVNMGHALTGPAWLDGALALARRQQAFLTGLQVAPAWPSATAGLVVSDRPVDAASDLERRRNGWLELCRKANISGEWETIRGICPEALAKRSRLADFVIGELPMDASDAPTGLDEIMRAQFAHAAPMLLVPDTFHDGLRTDRIVIAWNGSAEVAQAIKAARPLLVQASAVQVLDGERSGLPGLSPPSLPLRAWLQRHGITAQWHPFPAEHNEGPALLTAAKAFAADLMVVGVWGHVRGGAPVLGSTSRWLLEHTTLPLFLAR